MSHSLFPEYPVEPTPSTPREPAARPESQLSQLAAAMSAPAPAYGPHEDTQPVPRREEPWQPRSRGGAGLTAILVAMLLLLLTAFLTPLLIERWSYSVRSGQLRAEYELASTSIEQLNLTDFSQACQLLHQRVGPSVVNINSTRATSGLVSDQGERDINPWPEPLVEGQGSGVILDEEGHILTNYHVVRDAAVEVTLADGRVLTATLIGADLPTDLAVLKIEADNLSPAEWGDSEGLRPGSLVWALGSPFGLEQTITFGILSAKNRGWFAGKPYQDFLQSDVAINPGNSGGPLVDVQGRVVGINTAIVGDAYQGVSFAIPSSVARRVYEELLAGGQVSRGWLGVQLAEISREQATDIGLDAPRGALVADVVRGDLDPSPAEAAGVLQGDVILQWNGSDVASTTALMNKVALTQVDSTVEMVVLREGEELPLEVVVGRRPFLNQ